VKGRRWTAAILLPLFLVIAACTGTPDKGFGNGGLFVFRQADRFEGGNTGILPNGNLVGIGTDSSNEAWLYSVKPDGRLDTSFGGGAGRVDLGKPIYGGSGIVAVSATGRIYTSVGYLLRAWTPGGLPDPGFLTLNPLWPDGYLLAAPSGGVYDEAGGQIVRYTASGQIDPTFHILPTPAPVAGRLWLADSSGALYTGWGDGVARVLPNGTLDPRFGVGGVVTQPGRTLSPAGVAPDGSVYVETSHFGGRVGHAYVGRLTRTGQPDSHFGWFGVIALPDRPLPGLTTSLAPQVAVDRAGRLLVTEATIPCLNSVGSVLRYRADGSPDPTFGVNGVATPGTVAGYQTLNCPGDLQFDAQNRLLWNTVVTSGGQLFPGVLRLTN
jgi:uncharacterized delta-60 repeat protein